MANILIVDDDAAVQITIRLIPESAGRVTAAGDGQKGLFEAGQLDLPVLDIFMLCMNRLETMRRIRQPDVSFGRG